MKIEAFFQAAADGGQRLYIYHQPPPGQSIRGALLHVPALMEEMNKSRRMVARACRALAASGWAVLQVDLKGCGDSSADFGDATWQDWLDDLAQARRWLQSLHPERPLWLWGLRAGALQIGALMSQAAAHDNLLLWQPTTHGASSLTQLLRLKAAAHLMSGRGKEIIDAARADLAAGRSVDVSGYTIHPRLASGLAAATLKPVDSGTPHFLVWLETAAKNSAGGSAELTPACHVACAAWREAGWNVTAESVHGPAFWQTTELEDSPGLIEITVRTLAQLDAAH